MRFEDLRFYDGEMGTVDGEIWLNNGILLISTGACQISEPSTVFPKLHTLPKTNSLPLKIDDWNAVETKKDLDWIHLLGLCTPVFDTLLMEKYPAPFDSY